MSSLSRRTDQAAAVERALGSEVALRQMEQPLAFESCAPTCKHQLSRSPQVLTESVDYLRTLPSIASGWALVSYVSLAG